MSDQVLIALITAIAGIVGLIVKSAIDNKKLNDKVDGIAHNAREAKEQVTNTHDSNFRDDLDAFRVEMREGFSEFREEISILRGDVTQIRESDNTDRREHTSLWSAITSLGGRKE